jgi:hypothetical protein
MTLPFLWPNLGTIGYANHMSEMYRSGVPMVVGVLE